MIYFSKVINDIEEEREKQVNKGYTPENDDSYKNGELYYAAIAYILAPSNVKITPLNRDDFLFSSFWPFDCEIKPGDERENLIKAAALLVAEIERMDREKEAKR